MSVEFKDASLAATTTQAPTFEEMEAAFEQVLQDFKVIDRMTFLCVLGSFLTGVLHQVPEAEREAELTAFIEKLRFAVGNPGAQLQ